MGGTVEGKKSCPQVGRQEVAGSSFQPWGMIKWIIQKEAESLCMVGQTVMNWFLIKQTERTVTQKYGNTRRYTRASKVQVTLITISENDCDITGRRGDKKKKIQLMD